MNDQNNPRAQGMDARCAVTQAISELEHAARDDDRRIEYRRRSEATAQSLQEFLACYDVLMIHRDQLIAERNALLKVSAPSVNLIGACKAALSIACTELDNGMPDANLALCRIRDVTRSCT